MPSVPLYVSRRWKGWSASGVRCERKKEPTCHSAAASPSPPTGNIAWRARVGRPVRAQKRLFFSLADQAPESHVPNSMLHPGVRGCQVANQSRRLFFSLAPESVFSLLMGFRKHSPSSSWQSSSPQCSCRALPWRLTCRRPSKTWPSRGSPPVRRPPRFSTWSRRSVSRVVWPWLTLPLRYSPLPAGPHPPPRQGRDLGPEAIIHTPQRLSHGYSEVVVHQGYPWHSPGHVGPGPVQGTGAQGTPHSGRACVRSWGGGCEASSLSREDAAGASSTSESGPIFVGIRCVGPSGASPRRST